jgi:hypothetical protein
MESFSSQVAVRPDMTVPPQESGEANFSLPALTAGMQVHLLILECSPQSFKEDIILASLPSLQADSESVSLQAGHVVARGELTALIGVEDLQLSTTFECYVQIIKTEFRVKAV